MVERPSFDQFLRLRGADRRLARLTHDIALPVSYALAFGHEAWSLPLPDGVSVDQVRLGEVEEETAPEDGRDVPAWTGAGSLAAACQDRHAYDFALAVRSAQFAPDLFGWFADVFFALRPGGVLNLCLPDKRFTYDLRRPVSTLGEALEAQHRGARHPALRHAFDHTFEGVAIDPAEVWRGDVGAASAPRYGGDYALALAEAQLRRMLEGDAEVACHCWVFTPLSFLSMIEGASRLRRFDFVISQFAVTEPGEGEFFVCLRRDPQSDPDALLDLQLGALGHLRAIAERFERQNGEHARASGWRGTAG